jgi:hypothetical protein
VPADFDSPWKEALAKYFRALMELCFPEIAAVIDWSRGFDLLDTELHEMMRGSATGRQHVDKLVRVHLLNGEERKILIHIEVQHRPESDFPCRLYFYHIRLIEKGDSVVTVAILADTNPDWRPSRYENELLGCRITFDFPTCKLLDLLEKQDELEQSHSPAAVLVLANWATQQTQRDAGARLGWKKQLMRSLYAKDFKREDILELYRLIDWLLELPPPLEREFRTEIFNCERENDMPYVTNMERFGREEGIQQGIEQGIEQGMQQGLRVTREMIKETLLIRFGAVPEELVKGIDTETDLDKLRAAHRLAVTCKNVSEFSVA